MVNGEVLATKKNLEEFNKGVKESKKRGEKKKETKFEEGAEAVIVRRTNSH